MLIVCFWTLTTSNHAFSQAPFLHWPDTMFTYCPELRALFTCDVFGAHYANAKVFSNKLERQEIADWDYTIK